MNNCTCDQSEVVYWSFDYCNGSRNSCKNLPLPEIPNLTDHRVKFFQFKVAEKEYKRKRTGEVKLTKRTDRVQKEASIIDLAEDFASVRKEYLVYRYQIENDKFQWSRIVDTVSEYGRNYHLDYSENLQCSTKFEPQSANFNKDQYSLHCTVAHCFEERVYNKYIYHLSNDTNHDSRFTHAIYYP